MNPVILQKSTLNVDEIRVDFPNLLREVHPGVPLVYLDTTATSQKPVQVIAALDEMYRLHTANIHRGIHTLAEEATAAYEGAREKIAGFIHAASPREVIFTRNTTESINLVASSPTSILSKKWPQKESIFWFIIYFVNIFFREKTP